MKTKKLNASKILLIFGVSISLTVGYLGKPEIAQARGPSPRKTQQEKQVYSERGQDATSIRTLFTLVAVDDSGNDIQDHDGDDKNDRGYFPGAISDYTSDFGGELDPLQAFAISSIDFTTSPNGELSNLAQETGPKIEDFRNFENLRKGLQSKGYPSNNQGPLDLQAEKVLFESKEKEEYGVKYTVIGSATSMVVRPSDISRRGLSPKNDLTALINDLPFIIENFNWQFPDELNSPARYFVSEAEFIEPISDFISTPEPGILLGLISLMAASSKLIIAKH